MTIEKIKKYLQDKVNVNEITQGDMDFIIRQLDKIHEQDNILNIKSFSEEAIYCIYRILSIYYIDFLHNEKGIWRTDECIFDEINVEYNNDDIDEINKILKILVNKNILKVSMDCYTFSDAVINSLKISNDNEKENTKDSNAKDLIKTKASNMYMIYKNYHDEMFNQLGEVLNSYFGFDIECDNGKIDFRMNERLYSVYLSRGYIVLEKENEDEVWNADSVEDFIELIKDAEEDK